MTCCPCSSSSGRTSRPTPTAARRSIWAAANGRTASIRALVALGADPNRRGTFGGPDHGQGVTALHLAAQSGHAEAVEALLQLGADPTIADELHGGTPAGWADFGGHPELAARLRGP